MQYRVIKRILDGDTEDVNLKFEVIEVTDGADVTYAVKSADVTGVTDVAYAVNENDDVYNSCDWWDSEPPDVGALER